MKRFGAIVLLALASCDLFRSTKYDTFPENPYSDLSSILVLPFLNQSTTPFDGDELGNICASELAKFSGFRVFRPHHARMHVKPGEPVATLEDVLRIAKALKADAVLAVAVTDYDPYNPPKVALTVQLIRVSARSVSGEDIDLYTRLPSWHALPFPLTSQQAGHHGGVFDVVVDAHARMVQDEIDRYLDSQNRDELGFKDLREFLMVQSRFMQFVSSQILLRLFEAAS